MTRSYYWFSIQNVASNTLSINVLVFLYSIISSLLTISDARLKEIGEKTKSIAHSWYVWNRIVFVIQSILIRMTVFFLVNPFFKKERKISIRILSAASKQLLKRSFHHTETSVNWQLLNSTITCIPRAIWWKNTLNYSPALQLEPVVSRGISVITTRHYLFRCIKVPFLLPPQCDSVSGICTTDKSRLFEQTTNFAHVNLWMFAYERSATVSCV